MNIPSMHFSSRIAKLYKIVGIINMFNTLTANQKFITTSTGENILIFCSSGNGYVFLPIKHKSHFMYTTSRIDNYELLDKNVREAKGAIYRLPQGFELHQGHFLPVKQGVTPSPTFLGCCSGDIPGRPVKTK